MCDCATVLLARSFRCAICRHVIVGVVNDIPAVFVMADVSTGTVPDDHAPGLGLPVPAECPRAGAVGLDAVERVDGAVVPLIPHGTYSPSGRHSTRAVTKRIDFSLCSMRHSFGIYNERVFYCSAG